MTILSFAPHVDPLPYLVGQGRRLASSPQDLGDQYFFMPTRRGCRLLEAAFLAEAGDKSTFLPKIMPLGDPDLEAFPPALSQAVKNALPALPQPDAPYKQLLLAQQLVAGFPFAKAQSYKQQLTLAHDLLSFYEQLTTQGIDPMDLDTHNAETSVTFSGNSFAWEKFSFLGLFLKNWPLILKEERIVDRGTYRFMVLKTLAALWQNTPPKVPVFAAVSAGIIPPALLLLRTLRSLQGGQILLHGFPSQLPQEPLDQSHPFYFAQSLFLTLELTPADINFPPLESFSNSKTTFVEGFLCPGHQGPAPVGLDKAFSSVTLNAFDNEEQEARFIALKMRKNLETLQKKTALITPNRRLATRVQAHLARWGLSVDDSAGTPLNLRPPIAFLLQAANLLNRIEQFSGFGSLCASPFLNPQLKLSAMQIEAIKARFRPNLPLAPLLSVSSLHHWAEPRAALAKMPRMDAHSPRQWVLGLSQWLKSLGTTELWEYEEIPSFFQVLTHLAAQEAPLTLGQFLDLLMAACKQSSFRSPKGDHPRLSILGLREARLTKVDEAILAGLNEGTWPAKPTPNLWQYTSLQQTYDLPSDAEKIGHDGFDFWLNLCAPKQVTLTRALKDANGPTLPARWLSYLEVALQKTGLKLLPETQTCQDLACLDHYTPLDTKPQQAPKAYLDVAQWPDRISITQVGQFLSDPYAYYCRHILKIKEPQDSTPAYDNLMFGILTHKALDRFVKKAKEQANELDLSAHGFLQTCAQIFETEAPGALKNPFWNKLLHRLAHWVAPLLKQDLGQASTFFSELWSEMPIRPNVLTLYGKIDRLDIPAENQAPRAIDYKTGAPPTKTSVMNGQATQLPLELYLGTFALAAERRLNTEAATMAYWHLHYQDPKVIAFSVQETAQAVENARHHLENIARLWRDPRYSFTPADSLQDPTYQGFTRQTEWIKSP